MSDRTSSQVELFHALCKALPHLDYLRSLEVDGLRRAFQKVVTAYFRVHTIDIIAGLVENKLRI